MLIHFIPPSLPGPKDPQAQTFAGVVQEDARQGHHRADCPGLQGHLQAGLGGQSAEPGGAAVLRGRLLAQRARRKHSGVGAGKDF